MSSFVSAGRVASPPPGITRRQAAIAIAIAAVLLAAAGLLVGWAMRADPSADPIELIGGVPVGVEHTPAGALAAADNYLAVEQQTVERDPARLAALVAAVYLPKIRASSQAAAKDDRRRDPAGVARSAGGGQSFTVIGAHRLDHYAGDNAAVTTCAGQIFWGPGRPPAQTWALGQTTLVWSAGRWRVSAMTTLPAPAPTPATTPQASPGDDRAQVFDKLLSGFGPVSYDAPSG